MKSQEVIDTACDVIVGAVKFGLDVAGEKLLGPTGWQGFKKVSAPVFQRLQKRFPTLTFGDSKNEADAATAEDAVQYLRYDPDLQNILLSNYEKLRGKLPEMVAAMDRLESLSKEAFTKVETLAKTATEIIQEIENKNPTSGSEALPERVDVSDYLDETELLLRAMLRRKQIEMPDIVIAITVFASGIGWFIWKVLEEGRPLKVYKSEILGQRVTMSMQGNYTDPDGRLCRRFSTDTPFMQETSDGIGLDPERRVSTESIACRIAGQWQTIEELNKLVY